MASNALRLVPDVERRSSREPPPWLPLALSLLRYLRFGVRTAEVTEGAYHTQFDRSDDNHATVADAGRRLGYYWSRRGSNCLERDLVRSNFY